MGHILEPSKQNLKTTGSLVKVLYDGGPDWPIGLMRRIGPQWFIDTVDCGRLHLIGMFYSMVVKRRLCFAINEQTE